MRLSILLWLFMVINVGYAQPPSVTRVDSLAQLAQIMAIENPQEARRIIHELAVKSKKVNSGESTIKKHVAYSEFYIANNLWMQARAHIDSALAIAKKQKNSTQQINLLVLQGKLYFKLGENDLCKKLLGEAARLSVKSKNDSLLVKIKILQADYQKQSMSLAATISAKKQALAIALESKISTSVSDCYISIGSSYWQATHYNEALENYYKSLFIREKLNDTLGIILATKNIGLTYRELGYYEKGTARLEQCLSLAKQINNKFEIADILNIIGSLHYRFNRFDEAINYYCQSLSLREEQGLLRSQIATHENIARAQAQKALYEEALGHLSTALFIQEQIVDPLAESSTLTEMGNLNLQKGNVAEALRRYLMALKLRQTYGQDEDIAKSLTNIGLAYRRLGMYKSALKYLEQAHEIINSNELSTNESAYILQNLGHIYQDQKLFSKALSAYQEALALKEKGGDGAGTAKILKNIAQAQLQMGQLKNARASLTQALKISSRLNDAKDVADIYNEMGNVERQAQNTDIAISHFKNSAEKYQQLSNFDGKALCIRKIGEIQVLQKQFSDAEQNINQSIKIGIQTGNAYLQSYGYLALQSLYSAKGNYKLALNNYIKYTTINDSLERLKRNEANLEAQLDLELDQKKTEIKVMEAEVETLRQKSELDKTMIEKQKTFRNFLIIVILLIVTLAVTATFSLVQKRKYARALEEKIDEIRTINNKLILSEKHLTETIQTKDKLFSIIAHDLRSPFTALVGLSEVLAANARELSTGEIEEYSKHINQSAVGVLALTDNLLSWARSQTGKLILNPKVYPLQEMANRVIEVAQIPAKEKGIEIICKIDESISIYADYDTMSTAIRNLISNAIKFTPSGGKITIEAKKNKEYTEITVSDTGVGIEAENLSRLFKVNGLTTKGTNQENGTGLGLMLCKDFIEKNHGNISVESSIGLGTTFKVELPTNSEANDKKNT